MCWTALGGGSDRRDDIRRSPAPSNASAAIISTHLAGRMFTHAARSASSTPADHRDIASHRRTPALLGSPLLLLLRLVKSAPLSSSALHRVAMVRFQRPMTISSDERAGRIATQVVPAPAIRSSLRTPCFCVAVVPARTHVQSISPLSKRRIQPTQTCMLVIIIRKKKKIRRGHM